MITLAILGEIIKVLSRIAARISFFYVKYKRDPIYMRAHQIIIFDITQNHIIYHKIYVTMQFKKRYYEIKAKK